MSQESQEAVKWLENGFDHAYSNAVTKFGPFSLIQVNLFGVVETMKRVGAVPRFRGSEYIKHFKPLDGLMFEIKDQNDIYQGDQNDIYQGENLY